MEYVWPVTHPDDGTDEPLCPQSDQAPAGESEDRGGNRTERVRTIM